MLKLVVFGLFMSTGMARADQLLLTRERAQELYQNLDLPSEMGTKSFSSSDNLMRLECSLSLYEPVCEWTIVPTANARTWGELTRILVGPDVVQVKNGLELKTPHLQISCSGECVVGLKY